MKPAIGVCENWGDQPVAFSASWAMTILPPTFGLSFVGAVVTADDCTVVAVESPLAAVVAVELSLDFAVVSLVLPPPLLPQAAASTAVAASTAPRRRRVRLVAVMQLPQSRSPWIGTVAGGGRAVTSDTNQLLTAGQQPLTS